jgi:hypothetical protein
VAEVAAVAPIGLLGKTGQDLAAIVQFPQVATATVQDFGLFSFLTEVAAAAEVAVVFKVATVVRKRRCF